MLKKIKRFLSVNWQAKLICLVLAIVIWLVVRNGRVTEEQEYGRVLDGEIILSAP